MKAIMLRRLKDTIQDGAPLIQLPPRTLEIVSCDFDEDEWAFYAALEAKASLTMNKFIKRGEVMRNYTQVMLLLLRLRQGVFFVLSIGTLCCSSCMSLAACNHPILVSKDFQKDADALDSKPIGQSQQDDDDGGLADIFQKMGIDDAARRCDVCQIEYVSQFLSRGNPYVTTF